MKDITTFEWIFFIIIALGEVFIAMIMLIYLYTMIVSLLSLVPRLLFMKKLGNTLLAHANEVETMLKESVKRIFEKFFNLFSYIKEMSIEKYNERRLSRELKKVLDN